MENSTQRVTLNYLIPDEEDHPLTPKEVFVAGINHVGICGEHRQKIIAKLRHSEPIYLVRIPNHPDDANAVALFTADGKDIGFLPRELAEEVAPRLDAGSPVTATVSRIEQVQGKRDNYWGVRLSVVPYRLKHRSRNGKIPRMELLSRGGRRPDAQQPSTGPLQRWFSWLRGQ